jgi:cell division protein FtsB
LQGWGLFDNQLDEDLEGVELTLVAGMPVSFRYRLYEPHTPERPFVADEERTVAGPVEFRTLAAPALEAPPMPPAAPAMRHKMLAEMAPQALGDTISLAAAETSTLPVSVGEERGTLFQYRVAHPVSAARGQSAMVPIVGQRLDGHKELLYNGQKLPRHPVASLRMRNETGLTLERGPVTVIEEGNYAGEAVLPFTRAGAEVIVPYAVELGITVLEERRSERRTGAIHVRESYLLIQEWDLQHTIYRIDNTLSAAAEVVVEQALIQGYELTETAAPVEQSQGLARWPVMCPPGVETTFAVHQRREFSRREHIRGLAPRQLREFLRNRFLDEATYQALDGVLQIYGQIDAHQRRIGEIGKERQTTYEQQRQIQGSLGPLGREEEEGLLRARYIATLGQLEDQLATLAAEEQRLKAEIAQLEEEATKKLAALAS